MGRGRLTTGVLLWVVAAAAATAVGLTAVAAIGTDIFGAGRAPLSESEVRDQLAGAPAPTSTATSPPTSTPPSATDPTPPPTAPSSPAGEQRTTVTPGGTVISRCLPGNLVRVAQAVPAQGFRVDADDDDDDDPSVKFQSADRDIEVHLSCVDGVPVAQVEEDD